MAGPLLGSDGHGSLVWHGQLLRRVPELLREQVPPHELQHAFDNWVSAGLSHVRYGPAVYRGDVLFGTAGHGGGWRAHLHTVVHVSVDHDGPVAAFRGAGPDVRLGIWTHVRALRGGGVPVLPPTQSHRVGADHLRGLHGRRVLADRRARTHQQGGVCVGEQNHRVSVHPDGGLCNHEPAPESAAAAAQAGPERAARQFQSAAELAVPGSQRDYNVAIVNAATLLGRVSCGYVGDKLGRFNVMIPTLVLSGVLSLALWIPARSSAAALAFCITWGFATGPFVSLAPAILGQLFADELPSYLGVFFPTASVGVLVGPIIAGTFIPPGHVDTVEGFDKLSVFVGVLFLAAAASLSALRLVYQRRLLAKM
ncbi:hypothetical protein KL949_001350 [Ogataea haglerorum]|nr:hypothetical protein KL914_002477 [Ogataea haglerorum]KAG7719771.1 hypothetical protein KL913_001740 [Ogataea haglerorum]KAG7721618.1 hypothetical protein KL949_001350 [Ogataea haglerorum]KAG7739622.1 hypothetical protein KL923_002469 [Ogataea haglerorum]KAG7769946.1 hypothetical protein KL931_002465 [Ogataea haglerorum]